MHKKEQFKIVKLYRTEYGNYFVVLNKLIEITYEKIGMNYVGSATDKDGNIIASSYMSYAPSRGAFGGREITLKMKDGSKNKIKDYWYDGGYYPKHGEFVSIGANTLSGLQKCYVYFNINIEKNLFDRMLSDYYSRDKEYSYHEIEQWCLLQHKWHDVIINGKRLPIMVNKKHEFVERRYKTRVCAIINRVKFFKSASNSRFIRYSYFHYSYMEDGKLIKIERNLNEVLRESLGCRC